MTLVLTVLTHDVVVQVSDMRLTHPTTGEPVEVQAAKAVVYRRDFVFGYTGLACLEHEWSDQWLARTLSGPDEVTPAELAERAGRAVAARRVVDSRLAFVGAGWADTRRGREAAWMLVSNFGGPEGWRDTASPTFTSTVGILPRRWPYHVVPVGVPIPAGIVVELDRLLRRRIRKSRSKPAEVTSFLVSAVRGVAAVDPRVGPDLLVTSLPKESQAGPPAGLSIAFFDMVVGLGDPDFTRPVYRYVPAGDAAVAYVPAFANESGATFGGQIAFGDDARIPGPRPPCG